MKIPQLTNLPQLLGMHHRVPVEEDDSMYRSNRSKDDSSTHSIQGPELMDEDDDSKNLIPASSLPGSHLSRPRVRSILCILLAVIGAVGLLTHGLLKEVPRLSANLCCMPRIQVLSLCVPGSGLTWEWCMWSHGTLPPSTTTPSSKLARAQPTRGNESGRCMRQSVAMHRAAALVRPP